MKMKGGSYSAITVSESVLLYNKLFDYNKTKNS